MNYQVLKCDEFRKHYLHCFANLEDARRIISEFVARYNTEWLIERLGYRTPNHARADACRAAA